MNASDLSLKTKIVIAVLICVGLGAYARTMYRTEADNLQTSDSIVPSQCSAHLDGSHYRACLRKRNDPNYAFKKSDMFKCLAPKMGKAVRRALCESPMGCNTTGADLAKNDKWLDYAHRLKFELTRINALGLFSRPTGSFKRERILDLGTGPGYFSFALRRLGHETVGVDCADCGSGQDTVSPRICEALGVDRHEWRIAPPLPSLDGNDHEWNIVPPPADDVSRDGRPAPLQQMLPLSLGATPGCRFTGATAWLMQFSNGWDARTWKLFVAELYCRHLEPDASVTLQFLSAMEKHGEATNEHRPSRLVEQGAHGLFYKEFKARCYSDGLHPSSGTEVFLRDGKLRLHSDKPADPMLCVIPGRPAFVDQACPSR